jgi:hypothetical protein
MEIKKGDIVVVDDVRKKVLGIHHNDNILVEMNGELVQVFRENVLLKWDGLNYFQVKGELSTLNEQYVINKVPLIETRYDSDYWILIDTLRFTTPMYSYLGWFNDRGYNNPISIGNFTGTMVDISKSHSPLNIAGYSIPKYFCFDCAYAPTLIGTHSKYTYNPNQNITLDNEMVGDTLTIFTQTLFNSDVGEREIIEQNFKIIVE